MITDDMPLIQLAIVLVTAIGALNVGLANVAGTNLLIDVANLSGSMLDYAHIAIGAAGAVTIVDLADLVQDGGYDRIEPLED